MAGATGVEWMGTMTTTLPDTLRPGQRIQNGSGLFALAVATSQRDEFGCRLYRLRYEPHRVKGWAMPASLSTRVYSRDDLQAAGWVI